jgi:methionine-rich copper-binding protein CopC
MSLVKRVVRVAAALAIVACSDSTGPDFASVVEPLARGEVTSRTGVTFLAPVVSDPGTPSGTFDPDLQPRVEVCRRMSTPPGDCDTTQPVTAFGFGTAGRGTVRLDRGGQRYYVDWQAPDDLFLGPGTYRLGVFVGTALLASLDLWPVDDKAALDGVGTGYLGFVRGELVRIPFRIETDVLGAFTLTPPSSGVVVGGEQTFTVAMRDLHDQPMAGRAVTWSSTTASVASVTPASANADANGQATTKALGLAAGRASVVATAGGASISAPFPVDAAAPAVVSTVPADGASVESAAEVRLTFNEAVTAPAAAFAMTCDGVPVAFTVSPTAGTATTYVLTPAGTPTGSCAVLVRAGVIADADDSDPPDHMDADYTLTFAVDAAPRLIASDPNNGVLSVATSRPIVLTFSEPVNATPDAVIVGCPAGAVQPVTLSGNGTTTLTLTPFVPLTAGVTCVVTVQASEIHDVDPIDPPDGMRTNATFQFSTDAAPRVVQTRPVEGGSLGTSTTLAVTFSEPVSVTSDAFALECGGTAIAVVASAGPATVFDITPQSAVPHGVACTLTVAASRVSDVDANDAPDGMESDFTLHFGDDVGPTIVATSPVNGSVAVPGTNAITITFSEPVVHDGQAFVLVCAGVQRTFTVSPAVGAPATTVTLTPDAPMNGVCTVTVVAASVHDADVVDPPDQLPADVTFGFSAEVAPSVLSSTPSTGTAGVAVGGNITITFSEPVNAPTAAFLLSCNGVSQSFSVNAGPATTYTIDPIGNLPSASVCTLTIFASQVTDVDTLDPPDFMAQNVTITFTTQ